MKIFQLGIKEDDSAYIAGKKKLTNQISALCAFIGFFYSFFLYVHYPQVVVYPISLFFVSAAMLLLNHLGLFQVARFITSFQMLIHASLFHASIIPASDFLLMPFFSSMIAMTIIPWVLYDFQEIVKLVVTSIICLGLIFSQRILNRQLELEVDPTFYSESYLNPMTYAFAVAIGLILLTMIKTDKSSK